MRIGYGRVSTHDQNPEAQRDALLPAGCDQIFIDTTSGKLARRPEPDKALLSANRVGDQVVVTKLDRLGRSLEHLIELAKLLQTRGADLVVLDQGIDTSTAVGRLFFQILGAIAEFEHALMSERTIERKFYSQTNVALCTAGLWLPADAMRHKFKPFNGVVGIGDGPIVGRPFRASLGRFRCASVRTSHVYSAECVHGQTMVHARFRRR